MDNELRRLVERIDRKLWWLVFLLVAPYAFMILAGVIGALAGLD